MIKSRVRQTNSTVRHFVSGVTESGRIAPIYEIPEAQFIAITPGDGGFYLFRLSSDNELLGDMWFPTLEEAFRQAEFEFDVGQECWEEADEIFPMV
jgi:hypothetical protein